MFRFITAPLPRIVTALVAAVLLAALALSPAAAYAPIPTNHLVAQNINAKAMAAANQYSQLGDLQSTRYVIVTASGLTAGTTITFVSCQRDASGQPFTVKRSAKLFNGVPVLLDYGSPINPGNDGMFQAAWYAGISQTNVSLDIWAPVVSTAGGAAPLGSQSTTNANTTGDSKWG